MRVAITTESYLPYLSGVTVSVDALARGLGARGHEVLLLAPRPADGSAPAAVGSPGPEPRHAWLDSYQVPRLVPPAYRMPWPNPVGAPWRMARAFRPEIVHAHSPFVTGVLAARLARATGAPLVFTHHTRFADYGHYLGPLAGPGASVTGAYLRRFWLRCAAIVAPSGDLASEIANRLPPERRGSVHVVPTGIDVEGIRALTPIDARPDAGWPADAVVMATLGRLAPEKSPARLLEATAEVIRRAPRARLLVIGGGPAEAQLRLRAASDDLAGTVHFTGPLPRLEALARIAGADLFVFASRTETQGLVLAEALAAGLPAVALDGPGVRDSIRDGIDGRLVAAEPAGALALAMAELVLDEGERRRMAARARDDAGRFDLGGRIAEIEAIYRSVRR